MKGFLSQCLQFKGVSADVIGQQLPGSLKDISPDQIIHSNATLEHFSGPGKKPKAVLRVREPLGYIGPKSGSPLALSPAPDPEHADVIVLDDAGNAFRNQDQSWPKALESSSGPIVVYKMARPLARGMLWNRLKNNMPETLVVVVNADDIRRIEGVNISSSLSWERTAKDFVFQSGNRVPLKRCGRALISWFYSVRTAPFCTPAVKGVAQPLFSTRGLSKGALPPALTAE